MAKTKREIIQDLKLIDVVVELLDARIPISSRNPDIKKIIQNKKHLIVLNKMDLAEEKENQKWINYYKNNNENAILVDSNLGKGLKEFLNLIEKILEDEIIKSKNKGIKNKAIRIMILGIPNVGKSSLINRLANKKSTQVANKPGVTRQKQWVRIAKNIELLDTPGVLWPKFDDENIALNLSYTGTIKDDLIDKMQVSYILLKKLYKNYKNNLIMRYNIEEKEFEELEKLEQENNNNEDIVLNLMNIISKNRGAILPKNEIDYEKIANILLNDFKSGKLGRITLEKVYEK
jgi:ribosome biogenesis GTPase A